MKQTLVPGLEIKLERLHDISAIIHADRLPDGRLLITAIPLLYGSYTVTHGTGTFSLEPPSDLNLAAGWPIFKEPLRRKAEIHYNTYRTRLAPADGSAIAAVGSPTFTTPPENELIRVEPAIAVDAPKMAAVSPKSGPEPAQITKGGRNGKHRKGAPSPAPSVSPAPPVVAQQSPVITPKQEVKRTPPPSTPANIVAQSTPPIPAPSSPPVVSAMPATSTIPSPAGPTVLPALPLTDAENALASTAGGGSWKTFEPGKMPAGRLISTSDLKDVADRGLAGERYYLRGQFVVNFADANRAVLRPRARLAESVLRFGGGSARSMRIVVEFPAGYSPPAQGSVVNRDDARPYEVTDVRKQADGQLNVFVREIMQR
jgi:hypothetical protein